MKRVILLIASVAMISTNVVLGQKKVAVYITGGDDAGVNRVLGDKLVDAFTKSGKYTAIERTNSFLAEIGKEQAYQRTGAVNDREISRLGKQFGVQLVCVAEISEVFGKKYVSARLIDVETAEVVNTSSISSTLRGMKELLSVSEKITTELTDKTAKEKIADQTAADALRAAGYYVLDNIAVSTSVTKSIDWELAKEMAQTSTVGGYRDWRIPNLAELVQIHSNRTKIWRDIGEDTKLVWYFSDSPVWSVTMCKTGQQIVKGNGSSDCLTTQNKAGLILVRDVKSDSE